MSLKEEINIVHLHVRYKNYHTGIDRYLKMFSDGIASSEYSNIRVHQIIVTDDRDIIFPRIAYTENKTLYATIPIIYDNLLFSLDDFWKRRSMKIIVDMVKPYITGLPNLIFQCHYIYLFILAEELRRELGGKILTHLHCQPWKFSYNTDELRYNKLHQLYTTKQFKDFNDIENSKVNYKTSDKIICLSDVAKMYLVNTKMVPPEKIEIIVNGLAPVSNCRIFRDGPIEILYAGKISKDKGCYKMFDILDLVRKMGYEFKVLIAGSIGEHEKKYIHNMHKQLDITFLNQIPYSELKELYSRCTMGIIPSIHEQCSYVAIEMAMFGVPMIVSKVDALDEMFEDRKTALMVPLLFDPDLGLDFDKEIFINDIIELIENINLRKYLSKNVKQAYLNRFTLNTMMKHTVELYKQII